MANLQGSFYDCWQEVLFASVYVYVAVRRFLACLITCCLTFFVVCLPNISCESSDRTSQ